jgi:hypothetical protein
VHLAAACSRFHLREAIQSSGLRNLVAKVCRQIEITPLVYFREKLQLQCAKSSQLDLQFLQVCTFQFVDRKLSVDWEKKLKCSSPSMIYTHNPHASLFSTPRCTFRTLRTCAGDNNLHFYAGDLSHAARTISSDQGYYLWRSIQSHAGLIAGINYSESK